MSDTNTTNDPVAAAILDPHRVRTLWEKARNVDHPNVRRQRMDTIRAQIQAGTYETAERVDGAVDRLLVELAEKPNFADTIRAALPAAEEEAEDWDRRNCGDRFE